MNVDRLSAIILAAGLSTRMERFKPLLPLGKTTVVERVVGLYKDLGIEDICVVVGHNGHRIQAALAHAGVRCVVNPRYAQGMFSSILAGVGALPVDCRGFFIHPTDIPLVRHSTLAALAQAFETLPTHIVHPLFDGLRGHPPLVPACHRAAILGWSGERGLRGLWAEGDLPATNVPVADEGILLDLDTPADYMGVFARLMQADLPTPRECHALMAQVRTVPEAVRRHCNAVAAVAVRLAEAVSTAGFALDIDLVRAAAMVHDIAREQPDHAAAGAKLLKDLGYPRLAAIVRVHMDIPTVPEPPDEAGIVFLADKLVAGDRVVDLEERFSRKMAKYGARPEAAAAIRRRQDAAAALQISVERLAGRSVAAILADLKIKGDR